MTTPAQSCSAKECTTKFEEMYGRKAFTLKTMKERLPAEVYDHMVDTIERGAPLNSSVADIVAEAMKDWALEHGATHFAHWFHPLTGNTAEKHDSFMSPTGSGTAKISLRGKELIQGEPDASSFPGGGLRATFEARGYTAWDPASPAFIVENKNGSYLAIPTAFISWTGEALDHKVPLLRSIDALDRQARRALELFGISSRKVFTTVGTEQEYFLIDEKYHDKRRDLIVCGRTLLGAKPPKGQELDDHYFGRVSTRVLACMLEAEHRLYELGIPIKTRHNEVAPSQYEIAPTFADANLAADHQQLIMHTLRETAREYGFRCLLHEKPFAGINGSGKHNNWSVSTDGGLNLLEPGDTPVENERFLFFCAAVLKAVFRHQDLLRTSVASAANDHRLGANEAPPAIISVFLGDELSKIFAALAKGRKAVGKDGGVLGLGAKGLPELPRHSGDRNRTSPFAFTGNKFEFRAVGSSQSVSFPNVVLNVTVAEALDEMSTALEARLTAGEPLLDAVLGVVGKAAAEAQPILFEGDNYTEEWHREAEERGLLNLRDTVAAVSTLASEKNTQLFERFGVFTPRELRSRKEVMLEQYETTISIEASTLETLARTNVLPSAVTYLSELMDTCTKSSAMGLNISGTQTTGRKVSDALNMLVPAIDTLSELRQKHHDDVEEGAQYMRDHVIPAMEAVRKEADMLEQLVPARLWTLPTYLDMLFLH